MLCLQVCEWWTLSYKLQKTLMTPSYIIKNLTQLLFLNKFRFISEGKGKYHLGQTWLRVMGEQNWQPEPWTAPAARTQRIKMRVLKWFQVKQGLSWHGNMREKLYSVWNSSIKAENGQLDRELILNTLWNDSVLISTEKYLGYLACV